MSESSTELYICTNCGHAWEVTAETFSFCVECGDERTPLTRCQVLKEMVQKYIRSRKREIFLLTQEIGDLKRRVRLNNNDNFFLKQDLTKMNAMTTENVALKKDLEMWKNQTKLLAARLNPPTGTTIIAVESPAKEDIPKRKLARSSSMLSLNTNHENGDVQVSVPISPAELSSVPPRMKLQRSSSMTSLPIEDLIRANKKKKPRAMTAAELQPPGPKRKGSFSRMRHRKDSH